MVLKNEFQGHALRAQAAILRFPKNVGTSYSSRYMYSKAPQLGFRFRFTDRLPTLNSHIHYHSTYLLAIVTWSIFNVRQLWCYFHRIPKIIGRSEWNRMPYQAVSNLFGQLPTCQEKSDAVVDLQDTNNPSLG